MKKDNHEVLEGRKRQIEERLKRKNWTAQVEPMFEQANIGFEVSDRARAINCGGIGVIRLLVSRLKLAESINRRVRLLKAHLPYSESEPCVEHCVQHYEWRQHSGGHKATAQG